MPIRTPNISPPQRSYGIHELSRKTPVPGVLDSEHRHEAHARPPPVTTGAGHDRYGTERKQLQIDGEGQESGMDGVASGLKKATLQLAAKL